MYCSPARKNLPAEQHARDTLDTAGYPSPYRPVMPFLRRGFTPTSFKSPPESRTRNRASAHDPRLPIHVWAPRGGHGATNPSLRSGHRRESRHRGPSELDAARRHSPVPGAPPGSHLRQRAVIETLQNFFGTAKVSFSALSSLSNLTRSFDPAAESPWQVGRITRSGIAASARPKGSGRRV